MPRPYAEGTAQIRHKDTGDIHNVEGGSLEWDSQGTGERQMGPEVEHRGRLVRRSRRRQIPVDE